MSPTFDQILRDHLHETVLVEVDTVRIVFWSPATNIRYLATGALNSCTAFAIISPRAGILAHILPLPHGSTAESLRADPMSHQAAARYVHRILQETGRLYNTWRILFNPSETYAVAGKIGDRAYASSAAVGLIRSLTEELGIPLKLEEYDVIFDGRPRETGRTSIVIDAATPGQMPAVYVNNQWVEPARM
jgi:hypothetical protein